MLVRKRWGLLDVDFPSAIGVRRVNCAFQMDGQSWWRRKDCEWEAVKRPRWVLLV